MYIKNANTHARSVLNDQVGLSGSIIIHIRLLISNKPKDT